MKLLLILSRVCFQSSHQLHQNSRLLACKGSLQKISSIFTQRSKFPSVSTSFMQKRSNLHTLFLLESKFTFFVIGNWIRKLYSKCMCQQRNKLSICSYLKAHISCGDMEEQYPTLVVYGVCFMVCVHVAALVSFLIENIILDHLPKLAP